MKLSASSLSAQLNRALLALVCGCWLLGAAAVAWFVDHQVMQHLDNALLHSANRLLELAVHEMAEANAHRRLPAGSEPHLSIPAVPAPAPSDAFPEVPGGEFLVYQVVDGAHHILMRSQDAPSQAFDVPLRSGFDQTAQWRVYTLRHPVQPVYIHVADALADRQQLRHQALIFLLLPLLLVLPALAYGVRFVVNKRLRVVDQFAEQLQQRSGDDLSALHVQGLPDELLNLAGNVNRLLERLEHALHTERALSANAAHELRTPLTVMQLRLSNALALTSSGAARQELESVGAALRSLQRRAEKLLQLSRAESSASAAQAPVKLNALVRAVVQEFDGSMQAPDRLALDLTGDETVSGDFDTLAIALRNLIENSLRYSGQAQVEVGTRAPGMLYVRDHGPGVSAEKLQALLGRHVRFAQDEAGFGLGLSIVKSIVERHRGRLELHSPPQGFAQGFEVRLYLPVST